VKSSFVSSLRKMPWDRYAPQILLAALLASAVLVMTTQFSYHVAFENWLFWHYAQSWALTLGFNLACLVGGHWVVRILIPDGISIWKRLVFNNTVGVMAFGLFVFVLGITGILRKPFFFLLPLALFGLGIRSFVREIVFEWRNLQIAVRSQPKASWLWWLVVGFGIYSLAQLYLPVLIPENVGYDARWYHLPMAEQYATLGKIRPFSEGWLPGAQPQFASLIYTWAFLSPWGTLFDRVSTCAHIEFSLFLWTLASIPVMVSELCPSSYAKFSWVSLFLFPGIIIYDSNLVVAADHIAAFWAIPIYLSMSRAIRSMKVKDCVLFALCISGAALTKYTAMMIVIPPIFLLTVRSLWLGIKSFRKKDAQFLPSWWKGLVISGGLSLVLTSPHWLKNLLFYKNPVYPVMHSVFKSSAPWTGNSSHYYRLYQETAWIPHAPRITNTWELIQTVFTFSFIPHDWTQFHGTVPVFGSLFSVLIFSLPFLSQTRRLWLATLCSLLGIATWAGMLPQDRYLQTILPWLCAATAAFIIKIARTGIFSRLGIYALIGIQVVWGLDFYSFPAHSMVMAPIHKVAIDFFALTYKKGGNQVRLFPYRNYEEVAAKLPKNAVILLHEHRLQLGLGRRTISDFIPATLGIDYGELGSQAAIFHHLQTYGVTHVLSGEKNKLSHSVGGNLLFFGFLHEHTKFVGQVGKFKMYELDQRALVDQRVEKAAFFGCDYSYKTGLYPISALSVPVGLASVAPTYPVPIKVIDKKSKDKRWLDEVKYLAHEPSCALLETKDLAPFVLLTRYGNTNLYLRKH
jgi:hypothetical protein